MLIQCFSNFLKSGISKLVNLFLEHLQYNINFKPGWPTRKYLLFVQYFYYSKTTHSNLYSHTKIISYCIDFSFATIFICVFDFLAEHFKHQCSVEHILRTMLLIRYFVFSISKFLILNV